MVYDLEKCMGQKRYHSFFTVLLQCHFDPRVNTRLEIGLSIWVVAWTRHY